MVSSGEYLCWLYFLRHMVYRDPGTGQVKQAGILVGSILSGGDCRRQLVV
jgi:hypothetical protein